MDFIGNKLIGDFLSFTISNLIPVDKQESCGVGKNFWCSDWWTIEVAKYLYLGDHNYMRFNVPRRLVDNSNFSKKQIANDAMYKIKAFDIVSKRKTKFENLFVGEVGRGLDILIMFICKEDWKTVYCYDQNILHKDIVQSFFTKYFTINIIFDESTSEIYDNSKIPNNTLMIMNHSKSLVDKFSKNCNITSIIWDGVLVKGD